VRGASPPDVEALRSQRPLRLHLGCGDVSLASWVNVDGSSDSSADLVMDFRDVGQVFLPDTVDDILMIHSLSYLRLWEARDLLRSLNSLLRSGGKLVLEFPDIEKCAAAILERKGDEASYLEAVRGIYAFDTGQVTRRETYQPYAFGWSAGHLVRELEAAGFRDIAVKLPETHGQLAWRDSRVEATK